MMILLLKVKVIDLIYVADFSFYNDNFKLYLLLLKRLPTPRPGEVLGLVGTNGIGKSTALKILAGKLKPNLGRFSVYTLNI